MDIIGHDGQRAYLERFIAAAQSGVHCEHALVFSGTSAIGKYTVARACAEALIRKKKVAWKTFAEHVPSPALSIISPEREEKKTKSGVSVRYKDISVTQIRALKKSVAHSTHGARVIIVNDAERLSLAAKNALLKLLEEPPVQTFFFLITSDAEQLGETILSRAGIVQFYPLTESQFLSAQLGDATQYIQSQGRLGRLQVYAEDDASRTAAHEALAALRALKSQTTHERLTVAEKIAADSSACQDVLALWSVNIHHVAHEHKRYELLRLAERIDRVRRQMSATTNRRLMMEQLLLTL